MFKFNDAQILSPSINGRQELIFRCKVKKEDYTLEDFKKLCELMDSYSFACVLAPFQEEVEDRKPKLIQRLTMSIKDYCEKQGYKEEEEICHVYTRNGVQSRKEMTETQLEAEIDRYNL